jgi:hypothetical protein
LNDSNVRAGTTGKLVSCLQDPTRMRTNEKMTKR